MKKTICILCIACTFFTTKAQKPILAADINPIDSSNPSYLTVMNNKLYFYANDGTHGNEPYSYSETTGATIVADILPGSNSGCSGPASSNIAVLSNKIYFVAGTPSQLIYAYDGVNPPSVVSPVFNNLYYPLSLTAINGKLYFNADSNSYGSHLWTYDGINPPAMLNIIDPGYTFTEFRGNVYFASYFSDWNLTSLNPSSNSATAITVATQSSGFSLPLNTLATSTKLYFTARDTAGYELYSYDGTTASRLTNLALGPNRSGALGPLMEYNGSIYFSGSTDGTNFQLYRYSPILGGTSLVATINPSGNADIQSMIVYGGKLYFSAVTPSTGRELWSYDGTTTTMVADLNPGPADGMPLTGAIYSNSGLFAILNNHLYFSGNDGIHSNELFRLNTTTDVPNIQWDGHVVLYPNPAASFAALEITLYRPQPIKVNLVDVTGRIVYQTVPLSLVTGKNMITLPVENLAPGQYSYQIVDAESKARLWGGIFNKH